jgi:hypothetical protein
MPLLVVLVPVDLHCALPARADRVEDRMPAEIGKIEPVAQGYGEKVRVLIAIFVAPPVDE